MKREINRMRAQGRAWRLIEDYGFETAGPIPVEDIAMDNGVLCREGPLTGCVARLIRAGKSGIIRTKMGIRESGRKRWAVSHELGHWFLHENESQLFLCTAEDLRDYKGSPQEVEANIFASELLMPTKMFRPLVQNAEPKLETISGIAKVFDTSLTATGIRFVDEFKGECILIQSKNGKVEWAKQKQERTGLRIEKGMPLHRASLAFYARNGQQPAAETVPEEAWITQNWYGRTLEIIEESWHMEEYSSVLTLLVVTDADPEVKDSADRFASWQRTR